MQASNLPDTQSYTDTRKIVIDKVGIKNISHPITYIGRSGNKIPTIANFAMTVTLPENIKGVHMSRFIEILNEKPCEFSINSFDKLINRIITKLEAHTAHVDVSFPLFITKTAPSSKIKSLLDYQVTLYGIVDKNGFEITTKVVTPVTSLCPCSKSISKYGAHNQRSHITISTKIIKGSIFYIEDIIDLAEHEASCELYAVLKRDDEKFVTEKAYENPAFVEDLVRNIAIDLNNNNKISYYCIESENFESIHNHSAYAMIESYK